MHVWLINLWQNKQDYTMLARVSSTNGAGNTGKSHGKNEIRSFFNSKYKKVKNGLRT